MEIDELFASNNLHWTSYNELIVQALQNYYRRLEGMKVNPRSLLDEFLPQMPPQLGHESYPLEKLIPLLVEQMGDTLLHVDHPMYFGVFNPNPLFPAVCAEYLVAHFNPQLASTASARYAIEIEKQIISYFGQKCGYDKNMVEGTFCSGGTESNMTAVLSALQIKYPAFFQNGLQGLEGTLTVYTSSETHHSFKKILPLLGLGKALRVVAVDESFQFSISKLKEMIIYDKSHGDHPLMVVGTLGTTSAGTIDPLLELASTAHQFNLYFHVDAAYGGGAILLPELENKLVGIEKADSITIDAHKWFAVPMTSALFINRHPHLLFRIFNMGETPYMPQEKRKSEPYLESLSWSRRFNGLKLYMSLLVLGEEGYRKLFRHSMMLANFFRDLLSKKEGWIILNKTPLPIVLFRPSKLISFEEIEKFVQKINSKGECWITTTKIGQDNIPAIRVGFPNFITKTSDIEKLFLILTENYDKEFC